MLRKLFTLAAAVSAVLCVAVGVLWVRSDSVYDRLSFGRRGGRYVLAVSGARNAWVALAGDWDADEPLAVGSDPKSGPNTYIASVVWNVGGIRTWTMPGIEIESGTGWLATPSRRVVITAYPPQRLTGARVWWGWPFLTFAFLPVCWFSVRAPAVLRRRHRRSHGLCTACGYDLRASPDRCPECGAAPEQAAARSNRAPSVT
jgi:hypothetical protein